MDKCERLHYRVSGRVSTWRRFLPLAQTARRSAITLATALRHSGCGTLYAGRALKEGDDLAWQLSFNCCGLYRGTAARFLFLLHRCHEHAHGRTTRRTRCA